MGADENADSLEELPDAAWTHEKAPGSFDSSSVHSVPSEFAQEDKTYKARENNDIAVLESLNRKTKARMHRRGRLCHMIPVN